MDHSQRFSSSICAFLKSKIKGEKRPKRSQQKEVKNDQKKMYLTKDAKLHMKRGQN